MKTKITEVEQMNVSLENEQQMNVSFLESGPKGNDGVGVPIGGTTGQILSKKSDVDYDTEWIDAPTGGGSSEQGNDGATFIPSVNEEGIISWTNDKGLPNPQPVNIKGQDGIDGRNGVDGKDGYTPQKGVDYFDGINGINGQNGQDGYTPIKGVDYFDGAKGDTGEKGPQGEQGIQGPVGPKGEDGQQGPSGYTPVKGTDYFTQSDINTIVSQVISSLTNGEEVSY